MSVARGACERGQITTCPDYSQGGTRDGARKPAANSPLRLQSDLDELAGGAKPQEAAESVIQWLIDSGFEDQADGWI
jgi:hypothetical protein